MSKLFGVQYTCDNCGEHVLLPSGENNYRSERLPDGWFRTRYDLEDEEKDQVGDPLQPYLTQFNHFCSRSCAIEHLNKGL